MSETKDCVCRTKDFLKLIARFKFVHNLYAHYAMVTGAERTKQLFLKQKYIVYLCKMITK